ncbi:hypothetical protein D3876_05155 [Sphingomonas cavernae]|uniref:Glycosyltransferase RgtA/B/C/D-like domain-containing protein n=2 Tax=Sphingomonas cavernae TaxID=2320861 RepID=A0A418WQZ9_9SPHN|nr:hypothetical protein D3876_05155 [Sphingomonas cavernae]
MGRYRVELDLASSPGLQQFYDFQWRLIGNLGVDLLVIPLAKLFGLELAVKLIVMAIPPLTVTGFLLIAQEVHGRLPPTAALALPLAYGYPFQFGFINFALSMALTFLAFALWLKLTRARRLAVRNCIFVPLSVIIWTTHVFGWGVLGLLVFAAELTRLRGEGKRWTDAAFHGSLNCLPLAPPLLLMLMWRSGEVTGSTGDWFNWPAKIGYFAMMLLDRWRILDLFSVAVLAVTVYAAARDRETGFSRTIGIGALLLLAAYVFLPRVLIGSAYADMRLAPFVMAVALLAIRFAPACQQRHLQLVAVGALAFFLVRTTATTISFWLYDRDYDRELAAVPHIPEHARLVSFVGTTCNFPYWGLTKMEHLPSLALVRRGAYANDQWIMPGAQLLGTRHQEAGWFSRDPSQLTSREACKHEAWLTLNDALDRLPRSAFDYLWLINPPPFDRTKLDGLEMIWRDGNSALFRIPQRANTAFANGAKDDQP